MQDLELYPPPARKSVEKRTERLEEKDPATLRAEVTGALDQLRQYASIGTPEGGQRAQGPRERPSAIRDRVPGWLEQVEGGIRSLERIRDPEAADLKRQFEGIRREVVGRWVRDVFQDLDVFRQGRDLERTSGETLITRAREAFERAKRTLSPEESSDLDRRWRELLPKALERWADQLERKLQEAKEGAGRAIDKSLFESVRAFTAIARKLPGAEPLIDRLEKMGARLTATPRNEAPERERV